MPPDSAPDERVIAITGVGLVAPEAATADELWNRVQTGASPARVRESSNGLPPLAVCPVREPLNRSAGKPRLRREHRADRVTRLLLLAVSRAWADACFDPGSPPDPGTLAVVAGSSRGPVGRWADALATAGDRNSRVLPSLAADTTFACLHGSATALLGAEGPSFTVSAACSSGGHAIALAADQLLSGSTRVAVAGGADAPLHDALLRQFLATGILDPALPPAPVCRPFDRSANGTILGEAAGFLVMETLASAKARGAHIHGLLAGWGIAADGTATSAEAAGSTALRRASQNASRRARCDLSELGYLNVHGTGTRHNDDLEMEWIRQVDRDRDAPLPFSSTKAVTGHCLGATPVLEAILCLEALKRRCLPPSAHCRDAHPEAPAGLILQAGQPLTRPIVMSHSLGFWGGASSLIFRSLHL